jgi:Holliday junction resolvase
MGKASRDKGKRGERELVNWLKDHGYAARRGQQFQGSPDSPDVICDELGKYHIEVKRRETLSLYPAIDQAADDAGEDQTPVVFHRRNGKPWLVIQRAEDWLKRHRP